MCGALPCKLAHMGAGGEAFGDEGGAVGVSGFEGVEDFVEVGFHPIVEQIAAVVVPSQRVGIGEEEAGFWGEHVGLSGGIGGDDWASCCHVFHEDEVGASLAAVGEEADVGVAVELSETFVRNWAECEGAAEVNAVVGEKVGNDFLMRAAAEGA